MLLPMDMYICNMVELISDCFLKTKMTREQLPQESYVVKLT